MKKESSVAKAIKDVPSFGARYENFRMRLENESKSSSLIYNYSLQLSRICLHYGRLPEEISGEEYALYYNNLLKHHATGTLMKHAVYSVRSYFRIMNLKCPLGSNPPIPATRTLPVILSDNEVRELLKACVDLREKALIGLLCDTGMRKSEVLNLRLYDLDFERSTVHIRDGKGHKDRYVPFAQNMQKVVRAYCRRYRPQDYVFEQRKGVPMPQTWPPKVLSDAVKRTGIIKYVSCHTLRHVYACILLMAGVDIRRIQLWLGHKRLETTAVYLTIVNAPTDGRWTGVTDILFPVTYFHVVFTLPDAVLNSSMLGHMEAAYSALFAAAWGTIQSFADKAGIKMGMTAILHTWSADLNYHVHLHCIVPAGGIDKATGKWKTLPYVNDPESGHPFLFPVKAMSGIFRAKFMKAYTSKVKLSQSERGKCFGKRWNVYSKSPVCGPRKTLDYLAPYAYRVAISNNRIREVTDSDVTFTYKDYQDDGKNKEMTIKGDEFMRRYAQHILPPRFVRIRHYGFLAPGNRDILRELQKDMNVTPVPKPRKKKTWGDICLSKGKMLNQCPSCGVGIMQTVRYFPHIRSPEKIAV